ncbi:MAG: cell division protein FtsA [Candidatus Moranbacteria bacterium CG_4_10_14_3_um_filter_44_15]|nr:MAG: cell division protein FtsA [Candidatus Moranbacteria bacterium CG06_land_8_20_14_3_00_43_56]PIV83909.1 MAG: cell division protein FtsA [Candidatus Moranbacteria bacterium CG17_big_fil_post_rev_8_21_14_2_50_44_12]PIX90910.1 MAG: cell division protein FtsA [Candidatus Moranbacteria bacterium CG_4_10_14_3_um_filter_44_15]PJA86462.1 MAG: cell division protein FtsA [Candidatus Moranbacteria bacterium CG_4_9_14_3_um_filter_44_28]
MSKGNTVIGLDVGSSNVRVVILQKFEEEEKPRVMGVGIAPSFGIRRGVVADVEETVRAISDAVKNAERTSGIPISRALVSIGGSHIKYQESQGVVAIGKADGEITGDDVMRSLTAAETISLPSNTEIIHVIPRSFAVDDQKDIRDPLGINGIRLEVNAMLILGSTPIIKNLSKCIYQAGVEVDDMIFSALAAAKAALNKRQKELGVILVDIGGGTTSFAVYEEGDLVQVGVVPIGGGHITNDIAIGLRTSIDVAEKVKVNYGSALPDEIGKKDQINLAEIDQNEEGEVSRHHVAEIVEARLEEIFTMIDKELRKTNRSGMLPAGAIIVGGGAKLPGVVDLAKKILRLPAQTGFPLELGGIVDKVDEPGYVTATGLALWGIEETMISSPSNLRVRLPAIDGLPKISHTVDKMKGWLRKFLP